MASGMSNIELWVNYEPFCFGVIQAHTKLSKVYLKKVMQYARSKGAEGGFPKLKWSVWRHMAVNKMLLPETYAWTYFETYNTLKDVTWEQRLNEAEAMQRSYENESPESYKTKIEVDTMEFVILLYLQQASKISLRTSLVGEEWPRSSPRSRSSTPDTEPVKLSGIPNVLDEKNRVTFVFSNLTEILELLSEPDQLTDTSKLNRRISPDAVKALGFIIKGYLPKTDSIVDLHSLATRHRFQSKSGFSKTTNDFSCQIFETWLRALLVASHFGTRKLVEFGVPLPWVMPKKEKLGAFKRCRIVTSRLNSSHNMILFLHCSYQTVSRQTAALKESCVKLNKCNFSQFYLLSPLRSVSIEKCHDSTFVFGPVSKCIRISGCSNITLIAPCRMVIISTSNNITAHIATPSRPIIIGENNQKFSTDASSPMVTLAPYHTFYDQLEQHLTDIGLVISPQLDKWNDPITFSHTSLSRSRSLSGSTRLPIEDKSTVDLSSEKNGFFRILPPSEFFSFAIPFQTPDDESTTAFSKTTSVPWGLPAEYSQSLKEQHSEVVKYKTAVRKADMTRAERKSFQAEVETRFKEWLEKTGNKRQLDDLIDLGKAFSDAERK